MKRTTPRLALCCTFAAALAAGGAAVAGPGPAPPPGVYVIDATIAPVCLNGSYPITVQTAAGPLSGPLAVTTTIRGTLTGTLTLSAKTFTVTGTATSTSKGFRVALTARSGKDSITFAGSLTGQGINGTTKGKGSVAPGKGTFALDVSLAPPEIAAIVATLTPGKHGTLTGTATAVVCGAPVPLSVHGTPGKAFKLTLKAKGFTFTGKGAGPVTWTCAGFGAKVAGDNLPLATLPAPSGLAYGVSTAEFEEEEAIADDFPTTFMPRFTTFAASPALPAGLTIDAATGVISGTPTTAAPAATFTVTATNPAGSTQAPLTFDVRINRSKSFAVETGTLDDDALRHFLRRTQYGVRQSELDTLKTGGVAPYVDAMLVFPASPTPAETSAAPLLTSSTDLVGNFPSTTALARWWTQIMIDTQAPFQETLAFFWHDHFGVSSANFDGSESRWIATHVNLLRHEGNGNLRTLLLDVARDPAMLKFLDGFQNTKAKPNENFGREFWELFSLGVDNGYTQADIVESARALTGYRESYDSVSGLQNAVLDLPGRHDPGSKTILGQTILGQTATDDYAQVVDITLQHGKVAEYITKKLFEYFCYENPPQALVDTMAAQLRTQNYELTPFLKSLFTSEAFFSKKARRGLVKSPLEFTIGFIRSTGLKMTTSSTTAPAFDIGALDTSLTNQAQRPTQPPTVAGWPTGDLWLAAQGMVERINVVHVCVDDTTDQARLGISVNAILPPLASRTADSVVDTLAKLLDVQLTTQDRSDLVAYMNTTRDAAGNVTSSPFDPASQTQIDERCRGLLWILAQHPTYQAR